MGNQNSAIHHWAKFRTHRVGLMEAYGMTVTDEKIIVPTEEGRAAIIYPSDDPNGREFYEGQLVDGKRQGKGILIWKNGVCYEGDWTADCIHGEWGTMTWPDRRVYTGSWRRGVMDGVGVMTIWTRGNGELRYEGEWKAGQRDGKGKQTFGDNDPAGRVSYQGEWKDGKRDGQGVMLWRDGAVYIGQWEKGRRDGYGVHFDPATGQRYYGLWKDDLREDSNGRLVDRKGNEYHGGFVAGEKDGEGVFVFPHGRVMPEIWVKGVKVVAPARPFRWLALPAKKKKGSAVGTQAMIAPPPCRVQSLLVLCIEAVGTNPRLLKKLGVTHSARSASARTKVVLKHTRKAAAIAWQVGMGIPPDQNAALNNKPMPSLHDSLNQVALPPCAGPARKGKEQKKNVKKGKGKGKEKETEKERRRSEHFASYIIPQEVMEPLQSFVSSRKAMSVALKEKRASHSHKHHSY